MKKIKLLPVFLLIAGSFLFNPLKAQQFDGVISVFDDIAYLNLGSDFGLESAKFNYVETSSGNYTLNMTWYLTEGNSFIPNKGINKVPLIAFFDISFIPEQTFQIAYGEAKINKHGKCHIVIHVNGSGNGS